MHRFACISLLISNLFLKVTCIGPEHEQILQWWKHISDQKPINCQINSEYSKQFHPLTFRLSVANKNKVITSRPCTENDAQYLVHTFKGKIINNTLEGDIMT